MWVSPGAASNERDGAERPSQPIFGHDPFYFTASAVGGIRLLTFPPPK